MDCYIPDHRNSDDKFVSEFVVQVYVCWCVYDNICLLLCTSLVPRLLGPGRYEASYVLALCPGSWAQAGTRLAMYYLVPRLLGPGRYEASYVLALCPGSWAQAGTRLAMY